MKVFADKHPLIMNWTFDLPKDQWLDDKKLKENFIFQNPVDLVLICPRIGKKYTGSFLIFGVEFAKDSKTINFEVIPAWKGIMEESIKSDQGMISDLV